MKNHPLKETRTQLVYDLPMRLFHWLFAGLFVAAFLITKLVSSESATFSYHMLLGLTLAFTVLLRVGWGIIGTKYSRFRELQLSPKSLLEYFKGILSGQSHRHLGHNPASSWVGLIMLGLSLGLAFTGYQMTSGGNKEAFEDIHEIMANSFMILAVLHVLGIVLHTVRHKELIGLSMVDGKKMPVSGQDGIRSASPIVAVLFLLLVGVFATRVWAGYDQQKQTLNLFGTTLQLGENEGNEHGDAGEAGDKENKGDHDGDDD